MYLLNCIARVLVKYAGNAALFGFGGDALVELWDLWNKSTPDERQKLEETQTLAGSSDKETREKAQKLAKEVASDEPQMQETIKTFLTQIPAAVRCSLKRLADPSGRTLPPGIRLRNAKDLRKFLPVKLARFKPGDSPLPGDLELEELLGVGGFGEVWKARNTSLAARAPVALKFCLDQEIAGALLHEAAIQNQVGENNPGIVKLLHTYLRTDPPCLEYEYIAGGDLTGLIHDWHAMPGGCSWRAVAEIMIHLSEIIGAAHTLPSPIVHRDLKPANVLVQRAADGALQLKVTDFGIGAIAANRAIKEGEAAVKPAWYLTALATGTCTPLYASPQQKKGFPADPRDDVYALGVIWYQALTGILSDGVPSGAGWRRKLIERGMKQDLVDVLESCFDEEADERPPSAAELANRLKTLLSPPPPEKVPALVKTLCPRCHAALRIPANVAPGKKVRCPKCNFIFTPTPVPKSPLTPPMSPAPDKTAVNCWVIAPYRADHQDIWQRVWQFNLAHQFISIGWGDLGDISCLNEQELRELIDRSYPDAPAASKRSSFRMLWDFYHSVQPGDMVVARQGTKRLAGVGTVIGKAYYDPAKTVEALENESTFPNHVDVRWQDTPRDIAFPGPVFGLQTIYKISLEKYRGLITNDPQKSVDPASGVIGSIADFLLAVTEKDPLSKKDLVAKLTTSFPDRSPESMAATVNAQVPNRLAKEKGLKILKNANGYWATKIEEKAEPEDALSRIDTRRQTIRKKALEMLSARPEGLRYSEIIRDIHEACPEISLNTIHGNVWNLASVLPAEIYKPARGLFRAVKFRKPEASDQGKIEKAPLGEAHDESESKSNL